MDEKIKKMVLAGKILGEVLEEVLAAIKPGITELEIDKLAEDLIKKKGGEPGFKKVPGYKHTICISTNDVVVHGIPTKRVLEENDVVGIDCGVYFEGYHTDMAETLRVSTQNSPVSPSEAGRAKLKTQNYREIDKFLEIGKKAMFNAIRQARPENRVGHISQAMQKTIEGGGYAVVRSLVGHGVGKTLHEKPEIPGYLARKIEQTPKLSAGMTIAIEAIYNMGNAEVVYDRGDDWTIVSKDRSLSGLFERTVLITDKGPKLLTYLSGDKI